MDVNKRLSEAFKWLKEKGVVRNQTHLADLIGFDRATVSIYLNANSDREASKQFVEKFTEKFEDISNNWLMTGRGEMFINRGEDQPNTIRAGLNKYESSNTNQILSTMRILDEEKRRLGDAEIGILNEKKLLHDHINLLNEMLEAYKSRFGSLSDQSKRTA